MPKYLPFLLIFFLASQSAVAQELTPEWTRYQNTNSGGGLPTVNLPFVMIDSFSNIIICGSTYHPGPITGFITTKYDSLGNWQWEQKYDWFSLDQIRDGATDTQGNIYVTGNTGNPFTGLSAFVLFKYTAAGDTDWTYWYSSVNEPQVSTNIRNLFVLPNQNILLVGGRYNYQTQKGAAMVLCLSPDGQVIWETQLPDAGNLSARIVDDQLICWGRKNTPAGIGFNCWTLDLNGQTISAFPTTPYDDDFQSAYHIDTKGNLYIGDYYGEYKVTKFNTHGELEWFYHKPYIQGPTQNYVEARATGIVTDKDGDVWVGGIYYGGETAGSNFIVTHLNSSGEQQWEHFLFFNEMIAPDALLTNHAILNNKNNYLSINYSGLNLSEGQVGYSIIEYNKEGFKQGGFSTSEGKKMTATHILEYNKSWYIAGYQWDTIPEKQFVSKIRIPETVSTKEPNKAPEQLLTSFPNPAQRELHIAGIPAATKGSIQVHFFDQQGRLVFTCVTDNPLSNGEIIVHGLEVLHEGAYAFVVEQYGKLIGSGKMLKQ